MSIHSPPRPSPRGSAWAWPTPVHLTSTGRVPAVDGTQPAGGEPGIWQTRATWMTTLVKEQRREYERAEQGKPSGEVRGQQVPDPGMKIRGCSFWVHSVAQMPTAEIPRGRRWEAAEGEAAGGDSPLKGQSRHWGLCKGLKSCLRSHQHSDTPKWSGPWSSTSAGCWTIQSSSDTTLS